MRAVDAMMKLHPIDGIEVTGRASGSNRDVCGEIVVNTEGGGCRSQLTMTVTDVPAVVLTVMSAMLEVVMAPSLSVARAASAWLLGGTVLQQTV